MPLLISEHHGGDDAGGLLAPRYSSKSAASCAVIGARRPSGMADSVDSCDSLMSESFTRRSTKDSSRRTISSEERLITTPLNSVSSRRVTAVVLYSGAMTREG